MISCLWPTWFPLCGQWIKSVMAKQAILWQRAFERGDYDLRDWACYVNTMSEVARCAGP